jgi:bacterioferritin-associated ferredoxin
MTDSVPDDCARCGEEIGGVPRRFGFSEEAYDYLTARHDLEWYRHAPVAVVCGECFRQLHEIAEARLAAKLNGEGAPPLDDGGNLAAELDELDPARFVDEADG